MWRRRDRKKVGQELWRWHLVAQGAVVKHFGSLSKARAAGAFPLLASSAVVLWCCPIKSGIRGAQVTADDLKIEQFHWNR